MTQVLSWRVVEAQTQPSYHTPYCPSTSPSLQKTFTSCSRTHSVKYLLRTYYALVPILSAKDTWRLVNKIQHLPWRCMHSAAGELDSKQVNRELIKCWGVTSGGKRKSQQLLQVDRGRCYFRQRGQRRVLPGGRAFWANTWMEGSDQKLWL